MATTRVLAAFDSFKDCLGAQRVGMAVLQALKKERPFISTRLLALSDGGQGFIEALKEPLKLRLHNMQVTGPRGDPVLASFGSSAQSGLAVVEMARASGLELVPLEDRNPMNTTSRGTGELMRGAYHAGFRKFLLGVGGSATNDGGLGALQALGMEIQVRDDELGNLFSPPIFYGHHLTRLESIRLPEGSLMPGATIEIACDVKNPFTGPKGASHVFGPQKGATPSIVDELECGMQNLARMIEEQSDIRVENMEGAGAAGGISGSFVAFLGARLRKGVEIIGDAVGLEDAIASSDLIFTGEGCYDAQTKGGKTVSLVEYLGKKHGKPVVVICGRKKDVEQERERFVYDLLSLYTMEKSMSCTGECLAGLIHHNIGGFPVLGS